MATLTDTLSFIASNADETDLDRVIDAIKSRQATLRQVRAAAVRIGSQVRIDEISPKYLIGLTGTVTSMERKRCTVTLDEASSRRLRYQGGTRFFVAEGQTEYPLTGIPLSCCHINDDATAGAQA